MALRHFGSFMAASPVTPDVMSMGIHAYSTVFATYTLRQLQIPRMGMEHPPAGSEAELGFLGVQYVLSELSHDNARLRRQSFGIVVAQLQFSTFSTLLMKANQSLTSFGYVLPNK